MCPVLQRLCERVDHFAEASGTKPIGPVVTVTGNLYIEYAFTGPTVVYLQPAKGPALGCLHPQRPDSKSK